MLPSFIARKIEAWRFARQLDRNLAARREARLEGRVYVSGYTRGKA